LHDWGYAHTVRESNAIFPEVEGSLATEAALFACAFSSAAAADGTKRVQGEGLAEQQQCLLKKAQQE
jgi:hypothetical protein